MSKLTKNKYKIWFWLSVLIAMPFFRYCLAIATRGEPWLGYFCISLILLFAWIHSIEHNIQWIADNEKNTWSVHCSLTTGHTETYMTHVTCIYLTVSCYDSDQKCRVFDAIFGALDDCAIQHQFFEATINRSDVNKENKLIIYWK